MFFGDAIIITCEFTDKFKQKKKTEMVAMFLHFVYWNRANAAPKKVTV